MNYSELQEGVVFTCEVCCSNPECDTISDGELGTLPGDKCYWCGWPLETIPPEEDEEDGSKTILPKG